MKRNYGSGWFVRMESNIRTTNTFLFVNVLRTFEGEIFKIFKDIQLALRARLEVLFIIYIWATRPFNDITNTVKRKRLLSKTYRIQRNNL